MVRRLDDLTGAHTVGGQEVLGRAGALSRGRRRRAPGSGSARPAPASRRPGRPAAAPPRACRPPGPGRTGSPGRPRCGRLRHVVRAAGPLGRDHHPLPLNGPGAARPPVTPRARPRGGTARRNSPGAARKRRRQDAEQNPNARPRRRRVLPAPWHPHPAHRGAALPRQARCPATGPRRPGADQSTDEPQLIGDQARQQEPAADVFAPGRGQLPRRCPAMSSADPR